MARIARGRRVAAAAPRKHVVLLALLLLLLVSGTIYANSADYEVYALRPGESMVVYCFDRSRAMAEETFAGGIYVACAAAVEDSAIATYLPVVSRN